MKTIVVVTIPVGCPNAILGDFQRQLPETEDWSFEDAEGTLWPQVVSVSLPDEGNLSEDLLRHARSSEHDRVATIARKAFQHALKQHKLCTTPESWTHNP